MSVVAVRPLLASSSLVAAVGAVVGAGDPASSRVVYAMVVGLVLVGIALILLGVWLLRQTRPDLDVLAPLERMGDGDWKKRDPATQRRMLDEVRPAGAQPLAVHSPRPLLDRDFDQTNRPVTSFSDLGPGVVAEERDPTPIDADIDIDADDSDIDIDADVDTGASDDTDADVDTGASDDTVADVDDGTEMQTDSDTGTNSDTGSSPQPPRR